MGFSWSYLKKSRSWNKQTAKITEGGVRQRLGICWHLFTKEVTSETWVHKEELKSPTILLSHLISTFQRKWLWKRIGRSLYQPSVQNEMLQCVAHARVAYWGLTRSQYHREKKSHYEDCGTKWSCWLVEWVETLEIYIPHGSAGSLTWSSSGLLLTPHKDTAMCIGDRPIRHHFHNSKVSPCLSTVLS